MSGLADSILVSARDLYLENGLQGLSMRKIASRVGVTATALYRHFESKEALLDQVIDEGFQIFSSYLYRALAGTTPEERFRLAGEYYLQFALDQPKYYEIIFMLPDEHWRSNPSDEGHRSAETFQFLTDRVRECIDSGFLRKDEAEKVALTVWAHGHGLVSIYLANRIKMDRETFEKTYRESQSHLLAGLRS